MVLKIEKQIQTNRVFRVTAANPDVCQDLEESQMKERWSVGPDLVVMEVYSWPGQVCPFSFNS